MKLLTPAEVERLATIAGETNFDRWREQLEDQDARLERDVNGTFQEAFNRCLPLWTETGRIRDLSRCIRVPKYWPHYTKHLGEEFSYRFREHHDEVLRRLKDYPPNSSEYLCLCDLLIMIVEQYWTEDLPLPEALFQSKAAVPEVLCKEFRHDERFDASFDTIGSFLQRFHEVDHVD